MGLRRWFRRRPSDDELREELEAHVAMRAEHDGVDAFAARRRLGNLLRTRESMRRVWLAEWWDTASQDVRCTMRAWRRQPGFALTAVLVLAVGLGAATAMFSALDRILFRPLPYRDAERLVNVGMAFTFGDQSQTILISRGYQERWKPAPEPFTAITTMEEVNDTCDVTEQPAERLRCATVEGNFLKTLGVRPALGRDFTPDDNVRGAPPIAIISHVVWTRRFGGKPGAIGRTIELDGKHVPVIGVLPAGFVMPAGEADLLLPYSIAPPGSRSQSTLTAFGRLRPGVTPEQAKAAIAPLVADNIKSVPGLSEATFPPRVTPLRDYLVGDASRAAWLLLGAVAGLLLIACINVANLILARLAARTREFAVRSAVGAGRGRLARLAFTESLLLAVAGGALGWLLAATMLRVFVRLAPSSIPEIAQASLDLRVFAVAAALALATGAAVGIWPALSLLRNRTLQHGPRSTTAPHPRMRFTLVTAQIVVTVAMLAGSALLLRTLGNLAAVPLGYEGERVVTMNVALNGKLYPQKSRAAFFERLFERVREIPGTTAATMTSDVFPDGTSWLGTAFPVDGQPPDPKAQGPRMRVREVTPGYFETFRVPIVRGRAFAEADRDGRPMVILAESAARMLFPGQDPIGHTVGLAGSAEVVGIARDVRNTGLTQAPEPELYAVWSREGRASIRRESAFAYFAIRTQAGSASAIALLKQAVADLDPRLPVTIEPLEAEVDRRLERPRFLAWLLSVFAALALLLAAAGLYGVASFLVAQRTRDIGVRVALGAAPGDVAREVLAEAGRWITAGAAGGALLAWGTARAIESQLFGVAAADPVSWIAAFIVLAIALLAAVARPAARAAQVDPIVALRAD